MARRKPVPPEAELVLSEDRAFSVSKKYHCSKLSRNLINAQPFWSVLMDWRLRNFMTFFNMCRSGSLNSNAWALSSSSAKKDSSFPKKEARKWACEFLIASWGKVIHKAWKRRSYNAEVRWLRVLQLRAKTCRQPSGGQEQRPGWSGSHQSWPSFSGSNEISRWEDHWWRDKNTSKVWNM